MAPQVGVGFNRDSWNRLERHVRKLTKSYENVYCCTGPLYLPKKEVDGKNYVKYEVIGTNHVAVPTHFFKVVVCETTSGEFHMESYVMPNQFIDDNVPLTSFQVCTFYLNWYRNLTYQVALQVPPESIERASGLLFFDNLARKQIAKINGKKS